jgi:hypothetical protein
MAIDTREKRQSALGLLVPSFTPGIDPSAIDQAERQGAGWVYSGILAEAPAEPTAGGRRGHLLTLLVGRL